MSSPPTSVQIKRGIYVLAAVLAVLYATGSLLQLKHVADLDKMPLLAESLGLSKDAFNESRRQMTSDASKAAMYSVILDLFIALTVGFGVMGSLWRHVNERMLPKSRPVFKAALFISFWIILRYIVQFILTLATLASLSREYSALVSSPWHFVLTRLSPVISYFGIGQPIVNNTGVVGVLVVTLVFQTLGYLLYFGILQKFKPGIAFALLSILAFSIAIRDQELLLFSFSTCASMPENLLEPCKGLLDSTGFKASDIKMKPVIGFDAFYTCSLSREVVVFGKEYLNHPESICSVLAHELGHRTNKDILKLMGFKALYLIAKNAVTVFGVIPNAELFAAFGFETEPIIGGLAIADLAHALLGGLTDPLKLLLSRIYEYNADAFAKSKGYTEALAKFLVVTMNPKDNLSANTLYEWLYQTHPPTLKRAAELLG